MEGQPAHQPAHQFFDCPGCGAIHSYEILDLGVIFLARGHFVTEIHSRFFAAVLFGGKSPKDALAVIARSRRVMLSSRRFW